MMSGFALDVRLVSYGTRLTTRMVRLDPLDITLSLHCPACDMIHEWKQADAWIEGDPRRMIEAAGWNSAPTK
jgi:hypothetical protein